MLGTASQYTPFEFVWQRESHKYQILHWARAKGASRHA